MNLADVLIAVSQACRAGLLHVGHARPPIVVIPYAVGPLPPSRKNYVAHSGFTITCVARLAPQKGHMDLLDAMARIVGEVPEARLLLAGEGPLRGELEGRAKQLGLNGQVLFLGRVERTELSNLLDQTDVCVLPSYWEGLPVALIEAMSAGKPIVASNVGGNPELVADGENGLLVPPSNPRALAEALIRLALSPDVRRGMGEASRRRFELGGFTLEEVTAQTLEAYRMAMALASKR